MPFFQINDFWQVCTNWYELVQTGFLSIISDFDESEISVNFFSIENPIEITNFWLQHGVSSEIIEQIK